MLSLKAVAVVYLLVQYRLQPYRLHFYRGFGYAELNIGDADIAKGLSCIPNYNLYYSI